MLQSMRLHQLGHLILVLANTMCCLIRPVFGLECNAAEPLQFVRQGVPQSIGGLGIRDVDASAEIEYGIQATTGVVQFLNFTGLEIRTYLDQRVVVRGSPASLNGALNAVEYTSCYDCASHKDTIQITCSIVVPARLHETFAWTQKSEASIEIQVTLQYPSPMIRATQQHHEATEDKVLVIRDVHVIDVKPNAILNVTVIASTGTVAIRHNWLGSSASLTGIVDQVNSQLSLQGISYMAELDWSSDLCGSMVDLALVVYDVADPTRVAMEHLSVAVRATPDDPKVTTSASTIVLENSLGLTHAHVAIEDVDHCCNTLDLSNDASLAMVLLIKNAHVAIFPSPYMSQAPCEWSTADSAGRYPSDGSGWPTEVGLEYLEWTEPDSTSWRRIDGLAGPENSSGIVTNYLPEPVYVRQVRLEVLHFHGFPALRFELYGCTNITTDSWQWLNSTSCSGTGVATASGHASLQLCKAACTSGCRAVLWVENAADGVRCFQYTSCSTIFNDFSEVHLKTQALRNSCPRPYPLVFAPVEIANFTHISASSVQDSFYFSPLQASINGSSAWLPSLGDPVPYIQVSFDDVVIVTSIAIGGDPRKTSLIGCLTCGPLAGRLIEPLTVSRFDDFHGSANLHVQVQNLHSKRKASGELRIYVPSKVTNFLAPAVPYEMEEVIGPDSTQYVDIGSELALLDGSVGGSLTAVCSPDGMVGWLGEAPTNTLICPQCSVAEVRDRLSSLRYYPKIFSNGAKRIDIAVSNAETRSEQSEALMVWVRPVNTAPDVRPCNMAATPAVGEIWFTIKEDMLEAPICMLLEDDAAETSGNTVDLRVWVSHGMIHCQNSSLVKPMFFTECNDASSKAGEVSSKSCQLRTDPNMRPSVQQAAACLQNLVYTPPTNFHGAVDMLVAISDHGFSGAKQTREKVYIGGNVLEKPYGPRGDALTTSAMAVLNVTAVNDMPWLSWLFLPPASMHNNESLLLNGLSLSDVDADRLLPQEDASTFVLSIEALWGQIEAPTSHVVLTVPALPFQSRFVQLHGTVAELDIALKSVLYRPQPWFVGEDVVRIRAADGGVTGRGGNLTSEVGFSITIRQAMIVPSISIAAQEVFAREDEPLWLEAAGIKIGYPSQVVFIFFRLSASDGSFLPPLNKDKINEDLESHGAPAESLQRYISASLLSVEGVATAAAVTFIVARTQFLPPQHQWSSLDSTSTIKLETCLWDIEAKEMVAGTCAQATVAVLVQATHDAPVVYSKNHPWLVPLRILEDVPLQLCCFAFRDADLDATSATYWPSGAPWPLSVIVRVRAGNISLLVPQNVAVILVNASYVHIEGRLPDLKSALDTITYTPRHNMNKVNDGLDNLCIFVADVVGARQYNLGRHFSGCWDIDITPVNDPPVLVTESDALGEATSSCLPVAPPNPPSRFKLDNPGSGEAVQLPFVRLIDVDAEEKHLGGPAVTVVARAELGMIRKPDDCGGVQVQAFGPVAARSWELSGGVEALGICLGKLAYHAPSDMFEGEDVVILNASDSGHTGDEQADGHPGVAVLRVPLDIVRTEHRLRLEVPITTVEATEGLQLVLASLRLHYSPSLAGWRVVVSATASAGVLQILASREWLNENNVDLRAPQSGAKIEWLSDVQIAATLLQGQLAYMSNVSGSFHIQVTLRRERRADSWQFDHLATRSFRISVLSVNDAPMIQGPAHWTLMGGNVENLASVGITFKDRDAEEPVSRVHTEFLAGSDQTEGPDEHLGSEMRAVSVHIRTTVGSLSIHDWAGLFPVQPDQPCLPDCPSLAIRVRPSTLEILPARVFLRTVMTEGGMVGDLHMRIEDRGLVGAGLDRLSANHSISLNITHSDLPPSFEWLGNLDGPGASMYSAQYNSTRRMDATVGLGTSRMLNHTKERDIGVQIHAADGMYLRMYSCNITVPYGGYFELPHYNGDMLPPDFVALDYWLGTGPLSWLEMEGTLRDINVALETIYFHPHPGYSGVAYIDVRVGLKDSHHTNSTQVPIHVEPPDFCNMTIKVTPTLVVQGSMTLLIGTHVSLTAMAWEPTEWRGTRINDPTLVGNQTYQLSEHPEADCGPVTLELVVSQDDINASGRGIIFVESFAAVNRTVIPDTIRSNGAAVILHGNLSDISRILPHVLFRWLPDDGVEQHTNRPNHRITLHAHAYTSAWDPRRILSASCQITTHPSTEQAGEEAPFVALALRKPGDDHDWTRTHSLRVDEDSNITLCIRVTYNLPSEADLLAQGRMYLINIPDRTSDQTLVTEEDTKDLTNYNTMTMDVDVLHGSLQFTDAGFKDVNASGVVVERGCYNSTNCSFFSIKIRPLVYDEDVDGNFSICGLNYYPDPDFNTAPRSGPIFEERIRVSVAHPALAITHTKYVWLHVPIQVRPVFDGLRLEPMGSHVMVYQSSDVAVRQLLGISTPDSNLDPSPYILNSPTYYPLILNLSQGLFFETPLPTHCYNAQGLQWLIPAPSIGHTAAPLFSETLSRPSMMNLSAPMAALQRCVEDLVVVVPWDTPVTAPESQYQRFGPQLMGINPANGSVSQPQLFEVTFVFADGVEAGEGMIEIHDCGADGACGAYVDTADDTVARISPTDVTQVEVSRNYIKIRVTQKLAPMHWHQIAINKGAVRDVLGVNYTGMPRTGYTFHVGMGTSSPTGWRVVATPSRNGSQAVATNAQWNVCELSFFLLPGCPAFTQLNGTPASSGTYYDGPPQADPNPRASLAFDGQTSTCWQTAASVPGSWLGQHYNEPYLIRSFQITGLAGTNAPNELDVHFYFEPFWYILQTVNYTEGCVNITTNYQAVLGVNIDTTEPQLVSVEPPFGFEGISPYPRIYLTFNENVQVAAGRIIDFVNAGPDTRCMPHGSAKGSDDLFVNVSTTQARHYLANFSTPNVFALNNTVLITPGYKYLEMMRWHCLWIPRGAIQDSAGNAFYGFSEEDYRFRVGNSAYDVRNLYFLNSDPPRGSTIVGHQGIRIRLFFNKLLALNNAAGNITFTNKADPGNESFAIQLGDTKRIRFHLNFIDVFPGFDAPTNETLLSNRSWTMSITNYGIADTAGIPTIIPPHGQIHYLPHIFGGIDLAANYTFHIVPNPDIDRDHRTDFIEGVDCNLLGAPECPLRFAVAPTRTSVANVPVITPPGVYYTEPSPDKFHSDVFDDNGTLMFNLNLSNGTLEERMMVYSMDTDHWIQAITDNSSAKIVLTIAPANSPAQIRIQEPVIEGASGTPSFLTGVTVEDDGVETLHVNVTFEPIGEPFIHRSAWMTYGGRYLRWNYTYRLKPVSPSYGSDGDGDISHLTGRDVTASVISFSGNATQVTAALLNMTYACNSSYEGPAQVHITIRDGSFLAEGHMVMMIKAPPQQLRVNSSGQARHSVLANQVQNLRSAGCNFTVLDGGILTSSAFYTLNITSDDDESCTEFFFNDCNQHRPESRASTCETDISGISAAPASSRRVVRTGGTVQIKATDLKVLNHHLQNLLWKPCSCSLSLPSCVRQLHVFVERIASGWDQPSVTDFKTCAVTVVVTPDIFVAIGDGPLKTREDTALDMADRIHIRGHAPGKLIRLTLTTLNGSIVEPNTPYNKTGPAVNFTVDASSVDELAPLLKGTYVQYAPFTNFYGLDNLEVRVESFMAPNVIANIAQLNSTGALVVVRNFEIEVQPVADTPTIIFNNTAGFVNVTAAGTTSLQFNITYPEVKEDEVVRVRASVSFGSLTFPFLEGQMDDPFGGILSFFEDDKVETKQYLERAGGARYLQTGAAYTIVGTLGVVRYMLSGIVFHSPADGPKTGMLRMELKNTPTAANPETLQLPGLFDVSDVLSSIDITIVVRPLNMPTYACFLRGPANVFIDPTFQYGVYHSYPTENLGILIDLVTSPSELVSEELAKAEFSYRVWVNNGTIGMAVVPVNDPQAPAVLVCPPACNKDESSAWMIFGTVREAAARFRAVSYTPPAGFVGRDLMYVSATCAAGIIPITLSVKRVPRNIILQCGPAIGNVIVLERGAGAIAVPPCIISDAYGDLPLVVQIRITATLGTLAMALDAGLYWDNTVTLEKLHNASSAIQFSGPIAEVQRALSSKALLLHVPQNDIQRRGILVVEITDVRTDSITTNIRELHVNSDKLPSLSVDLSAFNATFVVGGQAGLQISFPPFLISSTLSTAPCLIVVEFPAGQLQLHPSGPGIQAVLWYSIPTRAEMFASSLSDANALLPTLKYIVQDADITDSPVRIAVRISVYAVPINATGSHVSGTAGPFDLMMNSNGFYSQAPLLPLVDAVKVLKDEKIMYLELHPAPSVPKVEVLTKKLHVIRNRATSLSVLAPRIIFPRALTVLLECNSCWLTDDALAFGHRHQISGPAKSVTDALQNMRVNVSCASCTSDELLVSVWDAQALQKASTEFAPRETSSSGILPYDNFYTSFTHIEIVVSSSNQAQMPPHLSILSKGFVAIAGDPLDLKNVVFLQSADPLEPLGLRAVQNNLEVSLACSQGAIAVDVTTLVGASTPYLNDNSTRAPVGRTADGLIEFAKQNSHRALNDPLYKVSPDPVGDFYASTSTTTSLMNATVVIDNENITNASTSSSKLGTRLYTNFDGRGIIWRNASLTIRGSAVDLSQALSSLIYIPNQSAGGQDVISINVTDRGRVSTRSGSLPVYVRRQAPDLSIVAPPLLNTTAGQPLRLGVSIAMNLVRPDDGLDVHISCSKCSLAMWPVTRELDAFSKNLSFTAASGQANALLSNVTYVTNETDSGFDRVDVEVRAHRLQAAGNREGAAKTQSSIAVLIRAVAAFAPKVNLSLRAHISLKEDQLISTQVVVEGMDSVVPSGIALAVSGQPCFRVRSHDAFIMQSASPAPCDLFLQVGGTPTSTQPCKKCMLRPATLPDQCVTWSGAIMAAAFQTSEGWVVAACKETNGVPDVSQAFETSIQSIVAHRFCVQNGNCIDKVGMTVTSSMYKGVPTETYDAKNLVCSGEQQVSGNAGNTITTYCFGSLRCEYHFNLALWNDPAPSCNKELNTSFTCPNGIAYEVTTPFPFYQISSVTTVLQCPVPLLPSQTSVAMRGGLLHGSFHLGAWKTLRHLRRLTDCALANANTSHNPTQVSFEMANSTPNASPNATQVQLIQGIANASVITPNSTQAQTVGQAQIASSSLAAMLNGVALQSFCVRGPPFALGEFASELKYRPSANFVGHEPMRISISDAHNASIIYAADQTWMHVENEVDNPTITAGMTDTTAVVGEVVRLSGVHLADADSNDGTRWMTLQVSATNGNIYVDPGHLTLPSETLKPFSRLDGAPAFRAQGSLFALQGLLDALMYGQLAPIKPYLNTRPLHQPKEGVIVSYLISDSTNASAQAFTRHIVSGSVKNPANGNAVDAAEVLITGVAGFSRMEVTDLAGTFAVIVPEGPLQMKFAKFNYETVSKNITVTGPVQAGGLADVYMPQRAVVTLWRVVLSWTSLTHKVDLDAHAIDAWKCHTYFALRQCDHPIDHGLTVSLSSDQRNKLFGQEAMTFLARPCNQNMAVNGGYGDIYSCRAQYWVQLFSTDSFADVNASITVYRDNTLMHNVMLPHTKNSSHAYWVGIELDFAANTVSRSISNTGTVDTAEAFITNVTLLPGRSLRALSTESEEQQRQADALTWLRSILNISKSGHEKLLNESRPRRLANVSLCNPPTTGFLNCPGYHCNSTVWTPWTVCRTICGDARRAGNESCDDGNTVLGDGCDNFCHIEIGFVCRGGTPYVQDHCYPICGDGKRIFTEACDDGNLNNGDGCSSACSIEVGFACFGGSNNASDVCRAAVCGDGIVEGAEECDDYNTLGGDGCSSDCRVEAAPPILFSETKITILVYNQPQSCRLTNAAQHTTPEDTVYHLQNTILTGDVETPGNVSIAVNVKNGFITLQPLVDQWRALSKTDAVPTAIVERETSISLRPFSLTPTYTVMSGTVEDVDRFLRYFLYIKPDTDFAGYIVVDFTMQSGITLGPDAVQCSTSVPILVTDVFNDSAEILLSSSYAQRGIDCTEMTLGCIIDGISVKDPDCAQVADGSCYLRLTLNVSMGFLHVAGLRWPVNSTLQPLEGHPAGLNAALRTVGWEPPSDKFGTGVMFVVLERLVSRTDATPLALQAMTTIRQVRLNVIPLDLPPTIKLDSGEAFHGSVFRVSGGKPFRIRNLRLEGPNANDTETVMIRVEVSRGALWLTNRGPLYFENGTAPGTVRLQFRAPAALMRSTYFTEIAYSWYDYDCLNLEQFNITVSNERLPAWTASAYLELPECQTFGLAWVGDPARVREDSSLALQGINVSSHDEDIFIVLTIRHPPGILGDCQLVFWPDRVNTFVPGRECHVDGLLRDLQRILPNVTYRPPPDFAGQVNLEVVASRRIPEDILSGIAPGTNLPTKNLIVPIMVLAENDAPILEVEQETLPIKEDVTTLVPLSPIFLSDVDAEKFPLRIKMEIVVGRDGGVLHMCGLKSFDSGYSPNRTNSGMLNAQGCLNQGLTVIEFNATVEDFNWMQSSPGRPGRLHFFPTRNWHGPVAINISVNDFGSGLTASEKTAYQILHLFVEPVSDKPKLTFTCAGDLPFAAYGRACLEIRECFELTAGYDENEDDTSMWLSISASHPEVSISLSDRSPVKVHNEGWSSIQVSGLYRDINQTLRTLVLRPPAWLFGTAYVPDTFEFEVYIAVAALGHMFNEPMPLAPMTNKPLPVNFTQYPGDATNFSVVYRRVNRPPNIFMGTSHFSSSQFFPSLSLPGISVRDPDARADAMFNVTMQVDGTTRGGALVFDGVENVFITKTMTLTDLNQKLKDLSFTFQDALWFGVTSFTISVSDLGNRGWVVDQYEDMYHGDTHPQVLSLRNGFARFIPENAEKYHRLYSADFSWEAYVKRWSSGAWDGGNGSFDTTVFQNGLSDGNNPMYHQLNDANNTLNSSRAFCSLTIDANGYPVVTLNSNAFHTFGGTGKTKLNVGAWYHVAVIVRRFSHVTLEGVPYDAIVGEIALYINKELDIAWPMDSGRAHFGGPSHSGVLLSIGGGSNDHPSELLLSRARIWGRALQPGELGACIDPLSPVGGGTEGIGEAGGSHQNQSDNATSFLTSPKHPGDGEAAALAFSFSFGGSLEEVRQRASVRTTGSWSFDVDAPPSCTSLTHSPYDNVFDHCVCHDRSLKSQGVPYFWHSPQAYTGVALDMKAFSKSHVHAFSGHALNASTQFVVYRKFVNEAPVFHYLEPANGRVETLEDNPTYVSLAITHKAHDQLVGRPFVLIISVSHGFVRSISAAAVVKMTTDRRRIEYRAMFFEINDFLAQIEYIPDPNWNGEDAIFITVSDLEFVVNTTLPVVVLPLSDPLTLVCPPAVDMMEGEVNVLIGANISVIDQDAAPGVSDSEVPVAVEMFVGDGGLQLNVPASLKRPLTMETALYDEFGAVNTNFMASPGWSELVNESSELGPTIRFNCTLGELRAFLNAVSFTPSPARFHGVVHFGLFISVLNTGEEASCDVGLTVHPVNTAPIISVDAARLHAIPGNQGRIGSGVVMNADEDVLFAGILKLSDPDEENFYDWFTRRTLAVRLLLSVSCGSLSWDLYKDSDYAYGVQHGSIAGTEGLTFLNGDGYKDPVLNVTSTLDHLNGQLHRLYYHSYACAGRNVTLFVELDDLGNYGAGGAQITTTKVKFDVLP